MRERERVMNGEILEGRLIGLCILCEKPLTYPPVLVPRSEHSLLTVVGVGSNNLRFDPNGLGGTDLDTPICIYEKRLSKMLHIGF